MQTFALILALAVLAVSGCAKAHARTEPEPPPLAAPAVPPRIIAPAEAESPEPDVAREETPPSPARPARPAPRPPAPKTEPARVESTPPPPDTPPDVRPPPPPQLRTPQTASDPQMERKVRDTLTRAGRLLNAVDYSAQRAQTREQYDTAKRFMVQAEEALKEKNYVFAIYLADKAETIAKALPR